MVCDEQTEKPHTVPVPATSPVQGPDPQPGTETFNARSNVKNRSLKKNGFLFFSWSYKTKIENI